MKLQVSKHDARLIQMDEADCGLKVLIAPKRIDNGFVEIFLGEQWQQLHKIVGYRLWGDKINGLAVKFQNDDSLDCRPENLYLENEDVSKV